MKTLARNISITMHGSQQLCDLVLACYASSTRPCLILMTTPTEKEKLDENSMFLSEPYAIATVNPPPGYLHGFSPQHFAFKVWAENEGLLEQLIDLRDEDGQLLFTRATTRDGLAFLSILLAFTKAPVFTLVGKALEAYREIVEEMHGVSVPK